jgi:TatD DNase family protein
MWLDSHAHLTASEFDADREEVLARAYDAGVEAMIAIGAGYGVAHNLRAAELAARDARIFATVGVHPHDAALLDDEGRQALERWVALPRVVAVGECGLDYHYDRSPRSVQQAVFAEQVALARRHDLPVSIHVRDDADAAYEDLLAIWQGEGRGTLQGVLHCYTGTLSFARRAIDAGFYVSFSGILTFKKDRGLREVAAALPLERLMVETDAPLLAPEGFRGRRNEPCRVALVGETLARVHGRAPEEVARITAANARTLFRLAAAPAPVGAAPHD